MRVETMDSRLASSLKTWRAPWYEPVHTTAKAWYRSAASADQTA